MVLWQQINYKTPIPYLINTYIREYDLSKANITALLYQKRISKEEYHRYASMDKSQREIQIGLLIQKDKSIYEDIQTGIKEAKRRFISSNKIDPSQIVSIKNDALFVMDGNQDLRICFPPFEFKIKNTYTMFLQLQELEVYYRDSINPSDGTIDTLIDIKGISDSKLSLHSGGLLDVICDTCYRLQRETPKETLSWVCSIYQKFLDRKLPKSYYRNFDSFSYYTIDTYYQTVSLEDIPDRAIPYLNINRNLNILRDLVGIVSAIYS